MAWPDESDERLDRMRRQRRNLRWRTVELKRQIEELRLVSAALFELLAEHADVSNEELIAKIEEIDGRDGVMDGRMREAGGPRKCPTCDRVVIKSAGQCLYCGPRD